MCLQSSTTCIVAGDLTLYQQGRLRITDMQKNAAIQDGDRIVTSNISSKFMPGILVGYAVDIKDDEKKLMKTGYLIPAADFDDLTEVLVLKDVKEDSFLDQNDGQDVLMKNTVASTPATAEGTEETSSAAGEESQSIDTTQTESQWSGMEGLTPLSEITGKSESAEGTQEESAG